MFLLLSENMSEDSIHPEMRAAARKWFVQNGVSIKEWATEHGVRVSVVYHVLHGKVYCTRGESHKVAVLLGLKAKAPEGDTRP